MYRLLLHHNVEKQLSKIPTSFVPQGLPSVARRIADAIRALREEPRPVPQSKHLTQELYRVRDGDYRIVYAVFDQEQIVFIGKVARRSEKVYRDLIALLAAAREAAEKP